VEVMGPRVALKKLGQNPGVFTVDMTSHTPGPKKVRLPLEGVALPLGARVLSIKPDVFVTEVRPIQSGKAKSK
jgi:hypothetical protein